MTDFKLDQDDADDYTFVVVDDDGSYHRFYLNTGEALDLYKVVNECIGDHWREGESVRHSIRVGPGAPRPQDEDCGYDLDDPKHPTYHERMVGYSDDR